MWILRALANLLVYVAVGVALALVVAALWALVRGGNFAASFRIACYLFGGVMLVLAAGRPATVVQRRGDVRPTARGACVDDSEPSRPVTEHRGRLPADGHRAARTGRRARRPALSLRLESARPGAVSSVGRAPARQAGGHWFEPSTAH